jgi:hypothetical protein
MDMLPITSLKDNKGPFTIGVPKKEKRTPRLFLELLSTNNIYMKQFLVRKIEYSNIRAFYDMHALH